MRKSIKPPISLLSYEGEIFNKVYPDYNIKVLLRELRNVVSEICYSPVWNASIDKPFNWKEQRIPINRFYWLYKNSKIILPKTHHYLDLIINSSTTNINLEEVATIISNSINELHPIVIDKNKELDKTIIKSSRSLNQWKGLMNGRKEKELIEKFTSNINSIKPKGLKSVLLHGSLADGLTKTGFSDFDVHYIIDFSFDKKEIVELMEWIYQSNKFLLSYNPFMHHGPMLVFEEELLLCSETVFPSTLVKNGVWLYGNSETIYYSKNDFENINSFNVFNDFFEKQFLKASDIKNVFDAIWWTSSVLFLPLLNVQMINQKSFWKRDVLSNRIEIPELYWNLIDKVSQVRLNISNHLDSKLNLPLNSTDSIKNPGEILSTYKEKFKLTEKRVINLGITTELITEAKQYFDYCRGNSVRLNEQNFKDKNYDYEKVTSNWVKDVCEIPIPIPINTYADVRKEFLQRCKQNSNVIAVYEFGNIGCPGLSDLDFLVVLSDTYFGIPENLTITKMNSEYADIMNHDPIFISEYELSTFSALSPIFNCKQIYGQTRVILTSDTFNHNIQEICYTIQNLVKYPTDLIWLSKQEKVRWKTLLAYLNSFNHVKKTLSVSTDSIPESIVKCIDFNLEIRNKFLKGYYSIEDLNTAFDLMIEASIDMINTYHKIWLKKIQNFNDTINTADLSLYREKVFASLRSKENKFPELPEVLTTVMNILTNKPTQNENQVKISNGLKEYLKEFQIIKDGFIRRELSKGRIISHYIADLSQVEKYRDSITSSFSINKSDPVDGFNTPVLFLIYNRQELTFETFEQIKKIKPKKLYVAADGPKKNKPNDYKNCEQTRQILLGIDWDCQVKTLFRESNLGCKIAVSSAINWFFENEEAGIIIEDDIIADKDFFLFCEEMLTKYADDNRIMHIAGNNLQFGWKKNEYSYYFSNYGSIWGWATWKRAWKLYDVEISKYPQFIMDQALQSIFNNEDEIQFRKSNFNEIFFNGLDTWDFQWTFARLSNSGLSIVSNKNLIKNIGFNKEATHTKDVNDLRANLQIEKLNFPLVHPNFIVRDTFSDNRYFNQVLMRRQDLVESVADKKFTETEFNDILLKAESYISNEKYVSARSLLKVLLTEDAYNLQALNDLAVLEILNDNYQQAQKLLNRVLTIDRQNQVALENYEILKNSVDSLQGKLNVFLPEIDTTIITSQNPLNFKAINLKIQNITWLRTDSIGDNVIASSMLQYLKEFFNQSKITVICQNHIKELYENCPFVDQVIGFDKSALTSDINYKKIFFTEVEKLETDLFINSVYSREQLSDEFVRASLATIKIGIDGDLSNISEANKNFGNNFYTYLVQLQSLNILELKRHEEFLDALGIEHEKLFPTVWLSDEDERWADNFFITNNLTKENTISLFAGAQHHHRLSENYGNAISAKLNDKDYKIILLGSEADQQINNINIANLNLDVIDLTGKTSLRQSASILKRCCLAIGAETALAHISCAVETKNIILLGGGHFGRFMPYTNLSSIISFPLNCFGCNWDCMYEVTHCIKNIDSLMIKEAISKTLSSNSKKIKIFVPQIEYQNENPSKWFDSISNSLEVQIIPIETKTKINFQDLSMKKNDFLKTDKYSLADAELEISNGNLVHASEILNKLLDKDESNTLVLNDIAVVQILNQEYDAAMSNLKKICTIEPDNEVALGNIEYINSNNLLQNQSKVIFENIDTPSDEISKIKLEYERLQSNWNTFGKNDPMWAILTDPAKKDNKWQPGEFFETGINDIERVISYTKQLNLNLNYNKAIDFGCGIGRLTQALAMKFNEAIGVDIAPSMINTANYHNRFKQRCKYVLNNKYDLSFIPSSDIDFIYTIITLQHMKPKFSKGFIQEFMRILKRGGVLIFQIPSRRKNQSFVNEPKMDDVQSFDASNPVMEMHGVFKDEVIKLLTDHGGKIIHIEDDKSLGEDWESFKYCVQKL